jgi:hypothetical protein
MIEIKPSSDCDAGHVFFTVIKDDIELGSFLLKIIKPNYIYNKNWLIEIIKILEQSELNVSYELFLRFGDNKQFLNYLAGPLYHYRENIEKYKILT